MLELETCPVRDEACGRLGNQIHFDKIVRLERTSGLDEIDDPVGQSHDRRQLNRAVQLDDFDRNPALVEKALGDPGIFRRDAHLG